VAFFQRSQALQPCAASRNVFRLEERRSLIALLEERPLSVLELLMELAGNGTIGSIPAIGHTTNVARRLASSHL